VLKSTRFKDNSHLILEVVTTPLERGWFSKIGCMTCKHHVFRCFRISTSKVWEVLSFYSGGEQMGCKMIFSNNFSSSCSEVLPLDRRTLIPLSICQSFWLPASPSSVPWTLLNFPNRTHSLRFAVLHTPKRGALQITWSGWCRGFFRQNSWTACQSKMVSMNQGILDTLILTWIDKMRSSH